MFFSRGFNKTQNPYTFVDIYKEYIKDIKEESLYYVTYNEFVEINSDFYKQIIDYIIDKSGTFKLPYGLGKINVLKEKIDLSKKLNVDWFLTQKYGETIYHLNEHSSGYKYTFHWSKRRSTLKNKYFYKLIFTRANKRRLAKTIKSKKRDYFEN